MRYHDVDAFMRDFGVTVIEYEYGFRVIDRNEIVASFDTDGEAREYVRDMMDDMNIKNSLGGY